MKSAVAFIFLVSICAIARAGSAAAPPSDAIEDLLQVVEQLQQRVAELEARVAALEATASPGLKAAASGSSVMVITSIEMAEPDAETLVEIAELRSKADAEDNLALKEQKEADRYISAGGKSSYESTRNQDSENDRKRKACLERAADHRNKAKELRGLALQLQRKVDDRGPLIRGWNGSRRVALQTSRALPGNLRNLVAGEFVTWKGSVRQSDGLLEIWSVTTLERVARPSGFQDEPKP